MLSNIARLAASREYVYQGTFAGIRELRCVLPLIVTGDPPDYQCAKWPLRGDGRLNLSTTPRSIYVEGRYTGRH